MEEEKQSEKDQVPEKFQSLVQAIEKLSVLDLAELVKVLEKRFGVSAAAPIMVAGGFPSAGAAPEEQTPEKTAFTVELVSVGDKKIEVIKLVRDATGKGLKEAKDLVDAAAAGPKAILENAKKEDAEELKKKFEAVGAKVELK